MTSVPCEVCQEPRPHHDMVHYGSIEGGYRLLCSRCFNADMARRNGLEDFENFRTEPITISDGTGQTHEFHCRTRLLGDVVALDAFELENGDPAGYQFQVIGDCNEDRFRLLARMIQKMRRALSVQHVADKHDGHGLQIVDQTVRGTIAWDDAEDGRIPMLVVDGKPVTWDELGRMLMTFEGSQFKLEIRDASEDL